MRSFPLRAYEIHSPRMWQQSQIDMAFDFILKHDMNALVLHENALVDEIIFPDRYFSNEILWKNWPVRRQGLLYPAPIICKRSLGKPSGETSSFSLKQRKSTLT